MHFETINNKKKKYFLYVLSLVVILLIIFEINNSSTKYKVTQSIKIAKRKINYEIGDQNLMGEYLQDREDYTLSNTIPESGYTLNSEKSYCKKGDKELETTIIYDVETKTLSITPIIEKGTKCYLHFDEFNLYSAIDIILANMATVTSRNSFSTTYTSSTTKTYYGTLIRLF